MSKEKPLHCNNFFTLDNNYALGYYEVVEENETQTRNTKMTTQDNEELRWEQVNENHWVYGTDWRLRFSRNRWYLEQMDNGTLPMPSVTWEVALPKDVPWDRILKLAAIKITERMDYYDEREKSRL